LAAVTIAHVHETASKALRQARRWKLVPSNVAADASPPEVPDRDMQVWNADELKVFLAATSGDRLAALWRLAAMTGLRRGEVLGLRWRDVDLERATLSVAKSKTASGKRAVALDTETVAALKRWRAQQNAERLQMGADWVDTGLTFTREDGDRVRESYVSHKFGRLVRQLGLPPIRLHDLRHGWATMALQSGIHPKVVQERLGHSTIAQTLDTYSHVIPGMHAAAAATVAALVAEVD
jgi:integrase